MFVKKRFIVVTILCLYVSLHTKAALARCNVDGVFISDAVMSGLTALYGTGRNKPPCSNDTCRAARDLLCSFSAMQHLDIPNSLGYDTIQERDRDYASWLAQVRGSERRGATRGPLYCALLARVAARVVGGLDKEPSTVRSVIETAARLDRHGVRCSPVVMAAFPRTAAVRDTLLKGTEWCWAGLQARCRRLAATWARMAPAPSPPIPGTP